MGLAAIFFILFLFLFILWVKCNRASLYLWLSKRPQWPSPLTADWLQELSAMQLHPSPPISGEGQGHMMDSSYSQSPLRGGGCRHLAMPSPWGAMWLGCSGHKDCWLPRGSQCFILVRFFFFSVSPPKAWSPPKIMVSAKILNLWFW